jgi:hypothetical protein
MTTWTIGQRTFRWRPGFAGRLVLGALVALLMAGTVVALVRADIGDDSADSSPAAEGELAKRASLASGDEDTSARVASNGAATGGASVVDGVAAPSVPGLVPKIVRTADVRVRVRGSFTAAVERANAVAALLGGFVTSSSTSSLGRGRSSAELTMRVPADQFDEARTRLGRLGKIESLEMHGRDVSGQLVDLDARLRAARAEEAALTILLGKAGSVGDILQIRDRLSGVRTEIEQLDGQQVALRDQVAMSTIHVALHEAGAPSRATEHESNETGIRESARDALNAAEAVVGGMLIVLGALSPIVGVVVVGWLIYAFTTRRRRPVTEHTFD